jgi:hypothetical protein
MGWWEQGPRDVWGDGPADHIDLALSAIVAEFEAEWGRKPTKDEIRAGLEFSLAAFDQPHLSVVK